MVGIGNHIGLYPVNDFNIPAAFQNIPTGLGGFGEGVYHPVVGNGNGRMPALVCLHHQGFGRGHTVHFRHIGVQMEFHPFFGGIVKHLHLLHGSNREGIKNIFFGVLVVIDFAEHHHAGAFFDFILKHGVLTACLFGGNFGGVRASLVGEHKGKTAGAPIPCVPTFHAENLPPDAGGAVIRRNIPNGFRVFGHPIAVDEFFGLSIIRQPIGRRTGKFHFFGFFHLYICRFLNGFFPFFLFCFIHHRVPADNQRHLIPEPQAATALEQFIYVGCRQHPCPAVGKGQGNPSGSHFQRSPFQHPDDHRFNDLDGFKKVLHRFFGVKSGVGGGKQVHPF